MGRISFEHTRQAVDGDHPGVDGEDATALVLEEESSRNPQKRPSVVLYLVVDRDIVLVLCQLSPS